MIQSWQYILIIIVFGQTIQQEVAGPGDWRLIEFIAEEHTYIVALLDKDMDVICTGTIINDDLIITSGRCVTKNPQFILLEVAVIDDIVIKNYRKAKVSRTILHSDYSLELKYKMKEPKLRALKSNIGLVFIKGTVLELFHERVNIGDFDDAELKDKQLTVVGFGAVKGTKRMILHRQWYQQMPCTSPNWYYCVCGLEYSTPPDSYSAELGEGAPVLYGSEIVAVTALPCGILSMTDTKIKYNVFTVISPYLRWINEQRENFHSESHKFVNLAPTKLVAKSGVNNEKQFSIRLICICLIVIKLHV